MKENMMGMPQQTEGKPTGLCYLVERGIHMVMDQSGILILTGKLQ